jgi:hypothetical protein|tara:strand:+ start:22 stop:429 length:408 start_codon:yes stop_codon:yes gene_type:complete
MTKILGKIFGNAAGGIVEKLGNVADKFITTGDEKRKFQKEMETLFIEAEAKMQENVTRRWEADLQYGNWLTRSVRPLVLIFLILSTVILVFIDSGSLKFEVADKWVDLLQLTLITTVGAFFGGRSYEKGQQIRKK